MRIRPYEPGDEASIVAGWNEVFPDQDGLARRDVGYWRWQFTANTLGRTEVIVAEEAGRVVGQYASVPQRAVDQGRPITIGLVVDAFVLPEWRGKGPRPGLVIHLARALHAAWCGRHATLAQPGHSLLYGYPVPIWRLAQRYLGSEMVRDLDVLFREIRAPRFEPQQVPSGVVVERLPRPGAAADALWARVAPEVRFGIVRDARYLDWRYADHPQRRYAFFLARDAASGEPRGLAVYGQGRYAVEAAGILCDWLIPVGDEPAEAALVGALEAHALSSGASVLLAVMPQNDPRFLRWQRRGFLVGPPSHFLVMNTFDHHVRFLRDVWFTTLGDSDLV